MSDTPQTDTAERKQEDEAEYIGHLVPADFARQLERERDALKMRESLVLCCKCNGPVVEFTVPSAVWNLVIRRGGPETDQEYLCKDCYISAASEYLLSSNAGADLLAKAQSAARLAGAIKKAPHAEGCYSYCPAHVSPEKWVCNCWKEAALREFEQTTISPNQQNT